VKTVEGGAAEDHVVCTLERDHLKGYGIFMVIIFIAEGNLEGDGPEGLCFVRVSTYMMFRLLPLSIRHLEKS
jgi:hypothetical protein